MQAIKAHIDLIQMQNAHFLLCVCITLNWCACDTICISVIGITENWPTIEIRVIICLLLAYVWVYGFFLFSKPNLALKNQIKYA